MATTKVMTAQDLLEMPDDGRRYELVKGELREVSPSGWEASFVGAQIVAAIGPFVKRHGLGAVTMADGGYRFEVEPDTVRAPDMAFVRAERLPTRAELVGYADVAPDLAVEVVSPNDTRREVAEKVAYYLAQGVPLVWTVWPGSLSVEAHRPGQAPKTFRVGDVLTAEDILPGFRLPVADIFA